MWSLQTISRRKESQYNHGGETTTMSDSIVDQIIASQYSLKRKRVNGEQDGNDRKKTWTRTIPSLFEISDIVHHISAQLFYTPIYFIKNIDNRSQEMMTYVPSRYNSLALRDLFNLLQTCRHMYNVVGKEIRQGVVSLIKSRDDDCAMCLGKTSACTACKKDYCYRCNVHHYPKAVCRHCTKDNIICPCIKEKNTLFTRNLTLKCFHCRHEIRLVSFK